MKTIQEYINEAAPKKPSGIVKTNSQLRKVMNSYLTGDVYDLHSGTYQQEDTYSSSESNGFILDKNGNIYEVITSSTQGDAGRIAGGSMSYSVTILNVDGKGGKISLYGYSAVFSKSYGDNIIPDIRRGYYLEDYLARNYSSIESSCKFLADPFIEKGDKDAKSYEDHKSDRKKDKAAAFVERYIKIYPRSFKWNIEGGLKIDYKGDDISEILKKMTEQTISETFNTSISNLNGFSGTLDIIDNNSGYLYFDTKKKNFVWVKEHKELRGLFNTVISKYEILSEPVNVVLGKSLVLIKDKISSEVNKWLDKIWNDFKKEKRHEHMDWVKHETEKIYNEKNQYKKIYTKTECKDIAERRWQSLIEGSDPIISNTLSYSIDILAKYIKNIEPVTSIEMPKPDTSYNDIEDLSNVVDEMPKRGQNTVMSKGAQKEAYRKMQDWHDRKRKQNIGAMSDAKLKMNYNVCKELGFDTEIEILKNEADKRGVILESKFTLKDYLNL